MDNSIFDVHDYIMKVFLKRKILYFASLLSFLSLNFLNFQLGLVVIIKNLIVSLILGVVILLVLVFLLYFFTPRLRCASDVECLTKSKMIFEDRTVKYKDQRFNKISRCLFVLLEHLFKDSALTSNQNRKELFFINLSSYMDKENIKEIKVISSSDSQNIDKMVEEIQIRLGLGNSNDETNFLLNLTNKKLDFSNIKGIILVEETNKSYAKDIEKILEYFEFNKIPILATVIINQLEI